MEEKLLVSLQELKSAIDSGGSIDTGDLSYDSLKTILDFLIEQEKENKKYIIKMTDEQYRKLVDIIRDKTSKEWKDKIKAICQKKRNQIFSCTYVDEKQWRPFDRAIDAINDLEQSLLEKE